MSTNKSWFSAFMVEPNIANINIFDEIGLYGVNAKDFGEYLRSLGQVDKINLHINSPGGEVFDGLAIHNMLRRSKAQITVYVDGLAASIASVIAMAGDEIIMPENAMMMVHDPSGVVVGTSKEMRDLADAMDKIKQAMISAYGSQSDLTRQEIADLMSKETWMSAQEALDYGFITKIEEPVKMVASYNISNLNKFKNAEKFSALLKDSSPIMDEEKTAIAPKLEKVDTMIEEVKASAAVETLAVEDAKDATIKEEINSTSEALDVAPQVERENKTIDESIDLIAKARDEERKRAADIFAICQLSNAQDRYQDFLASGKSLSDVVNLVRGVKAISSSQIDVRNSSDGQNKVHSWEKSLARVNSIKK